MDKNKFETQVTIFEKLINYAENVLKECGYAGDSPGTYNLSAILGMRRYL